MSPSCPVNVGETTIASSKLAKTTEVEHSLWQLSRRDGWVGLVLKLKERNLSKRTRLPESAWGFPEECANLGANESDPSDPDFATKVAVPSERREWTVRPASSWALGQPAELSEIG